MKLRYTMKRTLKVLGKLYIIQELQKYHCSVKVLFFYCFKFHVIHTSLNLTCTCPSSCMCLGGSPPVSPTQNHGILLILQGSVQEKLPSPCPAPLCIMGSCTHAVHPLFSLSFTNLYNFSISTKNLNEMINFLTIFFLWKFFFFW